ncbi:MAG: LysR family transcriptional regulator [Pseudomonadota bacterium]
MTAVTHLKSLQALELAVRVGTLQSAARELAISPAAVGQRIKSLEDFLGVDLLSRNRSGLKPTPALENALPHLSVAFRELSSAAEQLDLQRINEIHIAANSDFAELWLAPRLPAFKKRHPNVAFNINGEGEAPLRVGAPDCTIAFAAPTDDTELLFRDYLAAMTSPQNAERLKPLRRKNALEGFPLLHLDFYKDDPDALNWPQWIERHGFKRTAPARGIRYQRIAPALDAALSDAGFLICGAALLLPLLADGKIINLYPKKPVGWTAFAFNARFRATAMNRPIVKKFRGWLMEEAQATRKKLDWLAGENG